MKKDKIYTIAITVAAIVMLYFLLTNNSKFDSKIEVKQTQIDSLQNALTLHNTTIDSISNLLEEETQKHNYYAYKYKLLKQKKDEAITIINDYDEFQLDSIITNHRHQ